ncbi:MAG: DUF3800 domain-containing protein [Desulfobulbaceae bacterium]|nr:DUF3800 domain-containing protein [Desulfobulbaceae bacterium]
MSKVVYVDESGAHGFNSSDSRGNFYVISLVIIDEVKRSDFESKYLSVIRNHHQSEFLKYSTLKKKRNCNEIIDEIMKLEFSFFSLVVDKSKIHKDSGLKFKTVFYKFLHRIVYERLFKSFQKINIISDDYCDDDFHDSFKKYIKSITQGMSLFKDVEITFVNRDPIVQLSDIISGVFRDKQINEQIDIYNKLKTKSLFCYNFPQSFYINQDNVNDSLLEQNGVLNSDIIQEMSIKVTIEAIHKLKDENSKFLLHLLLLNSFSLHDDYIHSHKIVNHFKEFFDIDIEENQVKRSMIPKLRDKGVLISSSPKGYKLPTKYSDILDYIAITDRNVNNQINRLENFLKDFAIKLDKPIHDLVDESKYFKLNQILAR